MATIPTYNPRLPIPLFLIMLLTIFQLTSTQDVTWSSIPSIRTGQITSIATLTTSSDTSSSTTDATSSYATPLTLDQDLKYGLSLLSYQSWMTDTFSFNISMVSLSNTSITVKFLVLDNTFFTKAKVHYIVVWRPTTGTPFPNGNSASLTVDPYNAAYNNVDVVFGCYLTADLLIGTGTRSTFIGGKVTTDIYSNNHSQITQTSMIAGMRLSNSLGSNQHVQVNSFFNSSNYMYYNVTVQNNNFLQFICLTTFIYDPYVDTYYTKSIIQFQTMSLNSTNTGLKDIQYAQRYDGNSRMFFGFDKFNVSMSNSRYLNIQTSNISLISTYYQVNSAMNEININMLFFSFRNCLDSTQYYYPVDFQCVSSCPTESIAYPTATYGAADFLLCNPCHYSCATCSIGRNSAACDSCVAGAHRSGPTGGECPCDPTYTDIGEAVCVLCTEAMPGCVSCTSSTFCLDCDNVTYVLNSADNICDCSTGFFKISGYCLSYSGCLQATMFNNTLACISCNTASNYIQVLSTYSCTCNQGYFLNDTIQQCYDICGDGITALGHCDDNNTEYGDGCDQLCQVQQGYHCSTNYDSNGDPGISDCILITEVGVSYLYSQRVLNTNSFVMAFKVDPIKDGLTTNSFDSTNFITTLPIQNQQISYDPATQIIYLQADYLQSIQGTSHTVTIKYPNDNTFYAQDTVTSFTAEGINAQLTIDQKASYNDIIKFLIIGQGALTIIIAIFSSVVGLKLAGIQLLLPVQLIYFSLAALGSQLSYSSNLINLKYANGYSALATYQYSRTYSQNKNLVAIAYQSQFLLSTNVMLVIFVIVLVWLLVHHVMIKYKEGELEKLLSAKEVKGKEGDEGKNKEINSDQSQEREDVQMDSQRAKLKNRKKGTRKRMEEENQDDLMAEHELREDHHYSLKIFSFEVDRAYFISYVILINQMLFGFTVMSLNLPLSSFYYAQQISVIICNFLTFILMGNIVFIFYDQTSNKMINFTCINDRYAYLYLLTNTIIILVISYSFQQSWSIYLITPLTAFFILLVIIQKPYSKTLFQFQNLVALYLVVMLLTCQIMFCIIKSSSLEESLQLSITFIIVGIIFLGQVLTVIRVVLKVNFKKAFDDLKNPNSDRDDDHKKKLRVKEKNLDLLGKDDEEILPPDSVRKGLFAPKDMIDWEARNTEEYESAKMRDGHDTNEEEGNKSNEQEEHSEEKDEKLNQLELLKKRLRNTLKVKRQTEAKKSE